jgi:DNA-binding Lrp family transcriptional regulator
MKKKKVDVIDIKILKTLMEHAELNNKELSTTTGLSEGPTLVRVQNLWDRGILRSFHADINYQFFGYTKFYLIRAEVTDTDADELKQRFLLNRYIIVLVELEGSVDIVMRVYLGVLQTKSLKVAREELQILTAGLRGILSVTFNPICSYEQKTLHLDEKDLVK